MTRLMVAAGITPEVTSVRSGEEELTRITGAQAPSGVPVVITAPVVERERTRRPSSSSSRGRRGRPAGEGRSTGGAARRSSGGSGSSSRGQRRSSFGPAA